MKIYFQDPGHNKSAMILASMSPDMVDGIIELVSRYGRSLQSTIGSEDGPPRPLAILSRDYVADADFPLVFYGLTSMILAEFRTIKADNDFYEKVLMNAFALPQEIAGPAAAKIETYDVLGGSTDKTKTFAWYKRIGAQLQEGMRRVTNTLPKMLNIPWENDQSQDYDIDFLYELMLLGRAVDDLQARARLMKGQSMIAASMGLFEAKGDVYGDVYGDPDEVAEVILADAAKPLVGGILPKGILGGLAKLFNFGQNASETKVTQLARGAAGPQGNPAMSAAMQRIISGSPSVILAIDSATSSLGTVKSQLANLMGARENPDFGDVYSHVDSLYGDAVADAWNRGDLPSAMSHLADLAGDAFETTGDPELDESIIASVVGDVIEEMGDVEGADISEMGGLFSRARANKKIRKAKRLARRNKLREMRQKRKDAKAQRIVDADNQLSAAEQWGQDGIPEYPIAVQNSLSSQDGSYAADPQYNTQFDNSGFSNPDDFYNMDAVNA